MNAMGSPRTSDDVLSPVLDRLPRALASLVTRSARRTQLARDLTAAFGAWTTKRPVSREYRIAEKSTLPGELRLRVLEVRRETKDALSIVLERPADFRFLAGQFLTLLLLIDGKEVRRSYSLSSSALDASAPLVITVKRIHDGLASRFLHENVVAGSTLRVRGPSGNFTYEGSKDDEHLLLIGGGSGITPLMGIVRVALENQPRASVHLLFANRAEDDVIFRDELHRLRDEGRLALTHFLESHSETMEHTPGRLAKSHLEEALHGKDLAKLRAYVCGPEPMMDAVTSDLRALGVSPSKIHVERFASLRPREFASKTEPRRLVHKGRIAVIPPGKTVLEGAIAGNVDLDFSCTMGGCGACKVKLVSGDVVLDEPNCLTNEERAAGFILTCVAHPLTDVTIEKL